MQTGKDELGGAVKQHKAVGVDEAALTINNGKQEITSCALPEEDLALLLHISSCATLGVCAAL